MAIAGVCLKACQNGLGHFFPTIARLTEGGRAGLELFGQYPYRTNTFQKGASLTLFILRTCLGVLRVGREPGSQPKSDYLMIIEYLDL